jgi:hypothetical protein
VFDLVHTQIVTIHLPPSSVQATIQLPPETLTELERQPGLENAFTVINQDRNKIMLISMWQTEADMEAYEARSAHRDNLIQFANHFGGSLTREYLSPLISRETILKRASDQSSHPDDVDSALLLARSKPEKRNAQLLRVIPIAQQQEHDSTTVSLLSLEVYTDSFIILGRIVTEKKELCASGLHCFPHLENLSVSNDQGVYYQGTQQESGNMSQELRFTSAFMAPLHSTVRELYLEIPELRWECFNHGAKLQMLDSQPGPWKFSFALL